MPGRRRRGPMALATSLLVALGGVLVVLPAPPRATASSLAARRDHPGHHARHDQPRRRATSPAKRSGATSKATPTTEATPTTKARPGTAKPLTARQRAAARKRAAAERRAARIRHRWAKVDPRRPDTWPTWAPDDYTPPRGPHFNDPYGDERQRRALITQVIRSVNSAPGYRLHNPLVHRTMSCPTDPRLAPSTIKIAVYSIADQEFAAALAAAERRCVSVKVMMNSHLTVTTSRSWATIVDSLGKRPKDYDAARSFAMRCTNGCLGTSVMHAKYFLFSRAGRARDVVMTGSSNITRNAVRVQWNDLYTAVGSRTLYGQFRDHFRRMIPDVSEQGPWKYHAGRYSTLFYPDRRMTARSDQARRTLHNIRCTGARGGAGIHGHSVVTIAMHAWFGTRGLYLAQEVHRLYRQGCYVRILYSFMSRRTYDALGTARGERMVVRRVQFAGALGLVAVKYSHMKLLAVSGHLGHDRSAFVTWTGSNNWTDRGNHADEVVLRIASKRVYQAYVRQWRHIRDTRSTGVWALFHEPEGGGRAP